MTLLRFLQLMPAALLAALLIAQRWQRIRAWLWLRLFYFDPVAARVAAWCRRARRCMRCGYRLTAEEFTYYGHSCEWCEGRDE